MTWAAAGLLAGCSSRCGAARAEDTLSTGATVRAKLGEKLGQLWEKADKSLSDALGAEDDELARAASDIELGKGLDEETRKLQARELSVLGSEDVDAQQRLESEETELEDKINDVEQRLSKEEELLESQRAQLLREEAAILKKASEIQRREQDLLQEQASLLKDKNQLERSKLRIQDSLRSRRDRAFRLSVVGDLAKLITGQD